MEDQKHIVGFQIGLNLDSLTAWELQKLHKYVFFFTHKHLDTSVKWTKKERLVVKGIVAKVLLELVSMFSASSRTALFVHACTPGVRFE